MCVCTSVYLYAFMGVSTSLHVCSCEYVFLLFSNPEIADGLLNQTLNARLQNQQTYIVQVCDLPFLMSACVYVCALLDNILMALKLKHDPVEDDVSVPKVQTLYHTNCQQMSLLEIDVSLQRVY